MKIDIIGVPLNLGCDKQGVDLAPNTLRAKGLICVLKNKGHEVYDLGNLVVPEISSENKYIAHDKMKYLNTILEVNTNLAESVFNSIKGGSFPIVVGGDHAVGLGSVTGVSMACDNLGVIWIDAHGDINTYETTPSGNIHGMVLSALIGKGSSDLVNVYKVGSKIRSSNVFIVGVRSLDKGEKKLITKDKLNVYSVKYIRKKGIESVIYEIKNKIDENGIKNLHLSLDIDCLDPQFAMGTGTPVENGFTVEELKEFLSQIIKLNIVRSLDIVEYNPSLDNNGCTGDLIIDIVNSLSLEVV